MKRWAPALAILVAWDSFHLAAQPQTSSGVPSAFVKLDAVVVDHHERPVLGLRQEDFQIKEDGHAVAVTSFTEVSGGRSVVLLLPSGGPYDYRNVSAIGQQFLSHVTPTDTFAVVRPWYRDDAMDSVDVARRRIAEYRPGWLNPHPLDRWIDRLQRLSMQLESLTHRRKTIVCLTRCDPQVDLPETLIGPSLDWPSWRDALSAAARANVSLYRIDPDGVNGMPYVGEGFVALTGGFDFARASDFARVVDLIWDQSGHYYLLGYTPVSGAREYHTIDVSVRGSGVHVLARHQRGD